MSHKASARSTIAMGYINNSFKMKNSTSVKNHGAHFTLKISANQRFGTYAFPAHVLLLSETNSSFEMLCF